MGTSCLPDDLESTGQDSSYWASGPLRERFANFLCPIWGDSIRTQARRDSPQPERHKCSVPGKRAAPGLLTHTRMALLTGPLHGETLRTPNERPQGYQGPCPTSPPQGANAPQALGLQGLTGTLSVALGHSKGPRLIGMRHFFEEQISVSVRTSRLHEQQAQSSPQFTWAGRNTKGCSGVCESGDLECPHHHHHQSITNIPHVVLAPTTLFDDKPQKIRVQRVAENPPQLTQRPRGRAQSSSCPPPRPHLPSVYRRPQVR